MRSDGGGEPGDVLWCDEYALTMAQSFFLHEEDGDEVVFELFVRTLPRNRGYLIAAGLDSALEHLESLHCSGEAALFLEHQGIYTDGFLQRVRRVRFTGDVDGIAEGTPVGAATPLLRIRAPRLEATLVEGVLLAIINQQTLVATKAARIVDAAEGRAVWDFSLRRVHGPQAALGVARAAYLAGCAGTATVAAGHRYGIPTTGTMAHHFVLAFGPDREQAAFEQFLRDFPGRAVLLVDTYDTLRGVRHAIAAARTTGVPLAGIRLDSGDIGVLARQARKLLDDAGMREARIIASNDLDEYRIAALMRRQAPVDAFGVGTRLGTSSDAPALQGVYKLVEQCASGKPMPVMKHSRGKANDPGSHQVFRTDGVGDVVGMADEHLDGRPLLKPAMRQGARSQRAPSLTALRDSCIAQRSFLPAPVRALRSPRPWPVTHSPRLEALSEALSEGSLEWRGVKEVA
jgi:nicotinate phosphoribosyltransferase